MPTAAPRRGLLALAALLLACEEGPSPSPHAALLAALEPWPDCAGAAAERHELQVLVRGRVAGGRVIEERRCDTPAGPRRLFASIQRVAFLRGGERIVLEIASRALDDASGHPLRLQARLSQAGAPGPELEAGRLGDEMIVVRGQELRRVPFEPGAIDEWLVPEHAWPGRPPRAGERVRLRALSASAAGYTDLEVVALAAGPDAGPVLEHTSAAEPGTRTRWELTPARDLARLTASTGAWSMDLVPVPPGTPAAPVEPAQLDGLMHLPLAGRPLAPARQERVRFLLTRLPAAVRPEDLVGPGQRALPGPEPGALAVETWRLPPPPVVPFPPAAADPALRSWLAPTALVQADHPEIAARARELTRGTADAWEAALRLRAWVAAQVDGSMGFAFASALDTLRRGEGDCSEMALLLTALARAAGLPARPVYGLVPGAGGLVAHMWVEVWAGEWRPLDPAQGGQSVSPARLRLAEVPTRLTDDEPHYIMMAGLILSGMQVEVEDAR